MWQKPKLTPEQKASSKKESQRKYRLSNAEMLKEKAKHSWRIYRLQNLEKVKASNLEWRLKNPEKAKVYSARWRLKNKDKPYASSRAWQLRNPQKHKVYARLDSQRNMMNLTDSYVRKLLHIPAEHSEFYFLLIELKRFQISIHREIRSFHEKRQ